jgi:hypothetical protein
MLLMSSHCLQSISVSSLPVNLNAFYVLHPISSILELKGILSLMLTVAFIVLTPLTLKKNKVAFLGLLFVVIPLLPVLYIPVPGVGENTFTERYLYLPSFGFVIFFALFFSWAKANIPRAALTSTIGSMVLVGLYSVGTVSRNTIWKDDISLFTDAVIKSPDSVLPHNNLGGTLLIKGQADEAIEQFRIALQLRPDYAEAHNNLGSAYSDKGWIDVAIEHYLIALQLKPDHPLIHFNLGLAYKEKGLTNEAVREFETALMIKSDFTEAREALASVTK